MIFGFQTGEETEAGAYYDGWMSYITMKDVEWLTRLYPDFYRCDSPGANLAKDQAKEAKFFAADESIVKKIGEIRSLFGTSKTRIVVTISGMEIGIDEHKYKGIPVDYSRGGKDPDPFILINSLEYEVKTQ